MKFIEERLNFDIKEKTALFGFTDEILSIYTNALNIKSNKDILIVTNTLYEANKIYQSLLNYNENALFFPMDEFLTEEAIAISPDLEMTRVETINKLISDKGNHIIVTHLMGFLRYLPLKNIWKKNIISIKRNSDFDKQDLIKELYNIGYRIENTVTKTGEIANRGYILDIFPINEKNAIRLEFWGNTIDSIRYFDVETQLSLGELDSIEIYPISEFITNNEDAIRKQKYLPLYETVCSIKDYLDDSIVVYKDITQIRNSYLKLREDIFNYDVNIKDNKKTNYMFNLEELNNKYEMYVMNIDNIFNDKIDTSIKIDVKFANYYDNNFNKLNEDINNYISLNKTVIICLSSSHQLKNIVNYIESKNIITNENKIYKGLVNVINKKINDGFILDDYIVLSEKNLFKYTENKSTYKSNFKYGTKIGSLNKLNIGDYVVHNIHGIGVYMGIVAITKGDIKKDYLQIKYKDDGKLYIPVEKIDLISKYSSNEGVIPKLNKLGGVEWQKTKMRIKSKIKDIADMLMRISAERTAKEGYAFSKDTEEQIDFESEFVYEETKDQLLTAKQIKEDMESRIPMDRILCGDVGYGKTEVAFRAMFKAVCDNKQVAYLCPTTLLSNQQYNNALERFKSFPINIALLNRFTTSKETLRIIEGLNNKTIDIVFGTHRLLSKDIKFKDLGLLVIDEEQRFGVIHKEKIKEYKSNVDVLTLSATPIPRTLQMAMVGLRNLSLIETPPVDRYPIQTYVLEENDYVVKDAIYKEISRDGQVYILYNNIEKIENKAQEIRNLVSDAKVVFVHGQMNKIEIENIMMDFINRKYDVLICTTIIETGIDIPNVNTLIIIDADKFGLSQLYQIRGRVGRTNKIAYAYLMYNKRKVLSDIAVKRLSAIKEFTELGSGFNIAVRDLAIRGSGDILGSEQSGFIDTIGIELYTRMLNDEVNKLKGIKTEETEEEEEQPLVNVETHIEDSYVDIDEIKIEIHKKINEIASYEKLLSVKKELEDRFGTISENLLLYMHEEWFEKIARESGIEKINQNKNSIELVFNSEFTSKIEINSLFKKAYEICKMFRFSYSNNKLKIILDTIKLEKHWLYYCLDLLNNMDK